MSSLLENLNPEQLDAVTHNSGPLLIVAGAGTGKTTVITRRIAWLIEQKLAKPEEILALTFTEKAAEEMQERVDQLLPLGHFDMWISTFHSFCQRILETHALDIGLPHRFKLLDETAQWMLVHKHFDQFKLDYYKPLGSPYRFIDALLQHFSRCKDEVITPKDYLQYAESLSLNKGTPDGLEDADLATEIKRIKELAGAFHTYQQLLLKENALDFGDLINYCLKLFRERPNIKAHYQKLFKYVLVDEFQDTNIAQYELIKLLAQPESANLAPDAPNPKKLKPISYKPSANSQKSTTHSSLSLEADLSKSKTYNSTTLPLTTNLTVVGDDDQSIYKFRGASSSNILHFKEDFPQAKQVTLTLNYRSNQEILDLAYKFIQANNPDRLEVSLGISKKLINPNHQTPSTNQKFQKTNSKSQINSNNKNQKIENSQKPNGQMSAVSVLTAKDLSEELTQVVGNIVKIKAENPDTTWNNFAILIRSNSAAPEVVSRLEAEGIPYIYLSNTGLYKKPLVADLLAYLKLLDNYHDPLAFYRAFDLPKFKVTQDELSTITRFAHQKTLTLYEALKNNDLRAKLQAETTQSLDKLLSTLDDHSKRAARKSAVEVVVEIIHDLGVLELVSDDTLENAQNREFLEQFYKEVERYCEEAPDRSLKGFLEYLDLKMSSGNEGEIKFDPNSGPEAVKVMTVHAAKGLEFDFVFIIGLVDQRFPTRQKRDPIEIPEPLIKDILPSGDFHLQEERRLFYVAMTRAKKHLFLSWAKDYGGARSKKPSSFLIELGLVESEKTKSKPTGKVDFRKVPSPKPTEVIYKELPSVFSFSALNSFLRCPLEYKFMHYLRLPFPGSSYMSFGITMHKVFEEYLKEWKLRLEKNATDLFGQNEQPTLPSLDFLRELYKRHWVDDWYPTKQDKEERRSRGEQFLKVFYDQLVLEPPRPKYLEESFTLKFAEFQFKGKIDRADDTPEGLAIIDYKTGKAPKGKSDEDLDQLLVYQLAAQNYLGQKVKSLAYWYLEGNEWRKSPLATGGELQDLEERLLATMHKIVDTVKFDRFIEEHQAAPQHKCGFEELG